ncbi:MAG: protein translocase subunit SecD [Methylacidiphilales bacterium]|nr:protein translocase subunit SecD [Candidatus Methylacidiphilales bacterium]
MKTSNIIGNTKIPMGKNSNNPYVVGGVFLIIFFFTIYSLPNLWEDKPSLIITSKDGSELTNSHSSIKQILIENNLTISNVKQNDSDRIVYQFNTVKEQIIAKELILQTHKDIFNISLTLLSDTPEFFDSIKAKKMKLGLDLQGGVHLLLKISSDELVRQYLGSVLSEISQLLIENNLNVTSTEIISNSLFLYAQTIEQANNIFKILNNSFAQEISVNIQAPTAKGIPLLLQITNSRLSQLFKNAIEQNMRALNNRINELGVTEPIIQRQGIDKILIQLPGLQDTERAKKVLGSTASLEFRLVSLDQSGLVFKDRENQSVYLQPQIIVSGDSITDAVATIDSSTGEQIVSVRLDARGASKMEQVTAQNLQKPMAVIFKEKTFEGAQKNTVISTATIRDVLSSRFQISGLTKEESKELALYLRSGSLQSPVEIIEEKTIGPSLGTKNVESGFRSALVGVLLITLFMVFYYRFFGLIAISSLLVNFIMTISILSIFEATLTLPGIAGIVLNLGMAIDSNILIHERIKEELNAKRSFQDSIYFGYNRVFVTILDSNLTTLIAVMFLFSLGSGPVKGFAIVISVGAIATIFCAVTVSRILVNMFFNKFKDLPKWAL